MESYRVLVSGASAEIVEKKSRFIATVKKVESEEDAGRFIEEMKKKYWDARHNCYAYVIGENARLTRCSDDGEPSGTAGRPMLEVLLGEGIRDVCVVVTRYFGGTLLGTGGLVRAYTQAVKEGLSHCRTGILKRGAELKIRTDYNDVGKILYILGNMGLEQTDSEYGADVTVSVIISTENEEKLKKEITDKTGGRAVMEKVRELDFVE